MEIKMKVTQIAIHQWGDSIQVDLPDVGIMTMTDVLNPQELSNIQDIVAAAVMRKLNIPSLEKALNSNLLEHRPNVEHPLKEATTDPSLQD
jgi:hypothetical protein